jgi:uncharacterized protein YqeY
MELMKQKITLSKTVPIRANLYSVLLSEVKHLAKEEKRDVCDSDIIIVAKKMIKSLEKTVNQLPQEAKEKMDKEILILKEFVPAQLSYEETEKLVKSLIEFNKSITLSKSTMGAYIALVKKTGAEVDPAMVSKILMSML